MMSIYPCDIDGLRSCERLAAAFVIAGVMVASRESCIVCVTGMQSDIELDTIVIPTTRLRH